MTEWKTFLRRFEEGLGLDEPSKPFDPGYIEDDPRYSELAFAAKLERPDWDPRRRVCKKHGKAYVNDGGGPGQFSFCPTCRFPEDKP